MVITEKMKKTLTLVLVVAAMIGFGIYWIMNPGPEHIEDTNGPDDYSLQQITPEQVVALDMGSRGGLSTSENQFSFGNFAVSGGLKYSSTKFTGVLRIHACTIFKGSDIHVMLSDFRIKDGNFAFYVVLDGQIVGELIPDEFGMAEFLMGDIEKTGSLEYIIAGESANFRFTAPIEW